jgi:hypothetical protein
MQLKTSHGNRQPEDGRISRVFVLFSTEKTTQVIVSPKPQPLLMVQMIHRVLNSTR